jgi:hypothetical protein
LNIYIDERDKALKFLLKPISGALPSDVTERDRRLFATEYAHALNRRKILLTDEAITEMIDYLLGNIE